MKKIAIPALVYAVTAFAAPAFAQTPSAPANAALAAKLASLCRDKVQRQSLLAACLAVAENFRRGGDPSDGLDFAQAPQGGDIEVGGPWGTIVLRAGTNGIAKFLGDVNGRDDPSVVVVPPQASTSPSRGAGGGGRGGGGGGRSGQRGGF